MTARWKVFKNEMGFWTVRDRGPTGNLNMHLPDQGRVICGPADWWFGTWASAMEYTLAEARKWQRDSQVMPTPLYWHDARSFLDVLEYGWSYGIPEDGDVFLDTDDPELRHIVFFWNGEWRREQLGSGSVKL